MDILLSKCIARMNRWKGGRGKGGELSASAGPFTRNEEAGKIKTTFFQGVDPPKSKEGQGGTNVLRFQFSNVQNKQRKPEKVRRECNNREGS